MSARIVIAFVLGMLALVAAAVLYVMGKPGAALGTLVCVGVLAQLVSPNPGDVDAFIGERKARKGWHDRPDDDEGL